MRGLCLTPVLPAVHLDVAVVLLPIHIDPPPSGSPHTIGVKLGVVGHIVGQVQLVDLVVEPMNFLHLVDIASWLSPIVWVPS